MKNTRALTLIFSAVVASFGIGCGGGGRTGVTGVSIADMSGPIAHGPTIGGNDMGTSGSDSTCGGFVPTGTPACDTCLEGSACCADGTACANSASCTALVTCLGNCAQGDTTCANGCATQNQSGVATLQALQTCISSSCSTQCAAGGSGGGGTNPPPAGSCGTLQTGVAACDTCLDNSCCSQASTCSNSTACTAYLQCLQTNNCTTQACANQCGTAHPGGQAPYTALNTCLSTNCASACM